ncbi:MAG: L-threonylcarbamoyladenylate synthase [Salinivirgaceae bacterium]|jgi:L-threonylcarbamoyladenylate synthase|nr:L-threonylcarbamoyladenylate synthase [Salinivirgaceae bacterium]
MHDDIKKAKETLLNGGIICYPTDTIWGIGCDATNEEAVEKIYKIKKRDASKSMLILVDDLSRAYSYIKEFPEIAYDLFDTATSPLTIILPGAKNLASNLIATDGTIGIRVVNHPWCEKLIKQFKRPIVSTSANFSGDSSPAIFDEIDQNLLDKCDYVAEYEQDKVTKGQGSSIIKLGLGGEIKIIRK